MHFAAVFPSVQHRRRCVRARTSSSSNRSSSADIWRGMDVKELSVTADILEGLAPDDVTRPSSADRTLADEDFVLAMLAQEGASLVFDAHGGWCDLLAGAAPLPLASPPPPSRTNTPSCRPMARQSSNKPRRPSPQGMVMQCHST